MRAAKPRSRKVLRDAARRTVVLAIGAICLGATAATAKTYCVHTAAELQAALTDAGSSGTASNQDNTVRIAPGTFTTSGAAFSFGSLSGFSLTLEGGYNSACSSQDATPGVSVLDGGNLTQVLSIQSKGDITIRHLTIQNALYNGSAGGGAAIAMNGADPATLAIFDSNVVRNNVDGFASGGLTVFGLGTVHIENNLFTGNSSPAAAAFSTSMNDGSTIYITNNTISANTNTGSNNMITAIGGGGAIGHVSNTVSYGNHGTGAYDFYLSGFEQVDFVHDAYTSITGATAPGSSGNLIGTDPQFVAADNFHLRSTSPLLRAGTLTPAGGLPVVDLEGNPRSVAGFVDIGAYEDTDVIFANGFDPG